jgi:hypothetical protein
MNQIYRVRLAFCLYGLLSCACLFGAQSRGRDANATGAMSMIVSPEGFQKTNVRLSPGSYVFVILNRSGFDDIRVALERVATNAPADQLPQQEFEDIVGISRARLVKPANLVPGTYRLRVANRTNWVCTIYVD